MNTRSFINPTAHVQQPRKQAPAQSPEARGVALRHPVGKGDTARNGAPAAQARVAPLASPRYSTPALANAVWMMPEGDGWAEAYGEGWPAYDGESWAPAIGYDDGWALPSGDGWAPYEPGER